MLKKLLITMGLVSALGASTAFGGAGGDDFDLDVVGGDAARLYATEGLSKAAADVTTVALVPYYEILGTDFVAPAADLDVIAAIGVGLSQDAQIFIRYDLTNAVFTVDPGFTLANTTDTIAQGGASSPFVIFQLTATSNIAQGDGTLLTLVGAANTSGIAILGTATVNITMAVYETLTAATSGGIAIVSKTSSKGFVTPLSGLTTTIGASGTAPTAEVASIFTIYTVASAVAGTGNLVAPLGTANTILNTVVPTTDQDGTPAIIGDLLTVATSTVTFSGDLSFGTFGLSANATCAGLTAVALNTAKTDSTAVTLATTNATPILCSTVTGLVTIPETTITAVITPAAATGVTHAFPPAATTGTVNTIAHNGTTVQLSYLTTFVDYNQRLIIVNRSATDATYSVTFTSEAGVTAVAGTAATGTVKAGETLSIKVADIVTITGKTRTAGTLVIVAPSASLSVATNQVNLSDGSTDTVKHLN